MPEGVNVSRGKKICEQRSPLIKGILEWNVSEVDEMTRWIPKKKQPILTEKVRQRLYGTPGMNIFNYERDKPRPRKLYEPQFDVGMIPKEEPKRLTRCINILNSALKESLDESLLPKEGSEIRTAGKPILNKAHISQLKTNLIPTYNRVSRRKTFD
eukprot:XP_765782.1 hypothetical protein [Theileria parva strain Muguga]